MERRKSERVITNWKGTARVPASPIEVRVVDFSATGCRLRTNSDLIQVGRTVLLAIDGWAELAGQVKWVEHGYCGVEFQQPATPAKDSASARSARDFGIADRFGRPMPPLPAPGKVRLV